MTEKVINVSPKFNIMPADSNWTETTVTWNTAPAISNDIIATNTIPGGQTAVNRYIEFDVTAYMNSFMDATAGEDVTFAGQPVSYSGAKGSVWFASSRSSVGMPPVLEVELADKVFDTDASSFDKNTKQITATYTGTEADFIIVAVLYGSGNNLKNIAFSEENSNTLVYNIPDGVQDGDYVKFLLLSDMTDIKPLERPVSVNFIAE